ncbi:MAG: hypothetical protein MI717_05760 [Spirochaetales bacterium]|nr:hypothetical protein [Spirochaetales bacterium]
MILSRNFKPIDDDDYERLAAVSGRLRSVLEAFAEGTLPPEYGPKQLALYARTLVEHQRFDGSFAGHVRPEELDADVRTDLHRFVTWAALAFLCLLKTRHPEAAAEVEGLEGAVAGALRTSVVSDFAFPESGPAEPVQQVEAALVLASGGVPALIKAAPALAPELAKALKELAEGFKKRLEEKDTLLVGGIDYAPLYLQALEALGE